MWITTYTVAFALIAPFLWIDGAAAQTPPGRLLALDVFVGGIPRPEPAKPEDGEPADEYPQMRGWEIGGSVRPLSQLRSFSVTASYGQHSSSELTMRDTLVGVRMTSPWLVSGEGAVRGFTHVLVGYAWGRPVVGPPSGSPELVIGAGMDVLFLRVQGDYVRNKLTMDSQRVFLGGVFPLCFRGCREDWGDGLDLSGGR
jgi:hypothetical protein